MALKTSKLSWLVFHSLGLGCLSTSVFLQVLVFKDIVQQGYFLAIENNQLILSLEVFLTFFAIVYFAYIYQRFVRSLRWSLTLKILMLEATSNWGSEVHPIILSQCYDLIMSLRFSSISCSDSDMPSSFSTPYFIMYRPMTMKTNKPTITGIWYFNVANQSPCPYQTTRLHSVPKRNTEDKPRTIKPIQKTIVFSPSNKLNHHTTTETLLFYM